MDSHIHDILLKFSGDAKKILGENMKRVIVYGSYARDDYNAQSDIDIMILTDIEEDQIRSYEYQLYDIAYDYLMDYDIDISIILKNIDHFNYWLGALPFYDNVQREGKLLYSCNGQSCFASQNKEER